MAKEHAPAFQFYPREFLMDEHVAVMTLEERGAYITLMCTCWTEQSIPCDVKRLSRLLGTSPRKTRALWDVLAPRFIETDGRCRHKKLDAIRERQRRYSSAQSARGRSGADKRWQTPLNPNGTSIASTEIGDGRSETSTDDAPGKFFAWWFTTYPKYRNGARYNGNQRTDFDNLTQLLSTYSIEELQHIATVFLQIPDDKMPELKGQTRTLGWLRAKASAIDERLRSRA